MRLRVRVWGVALLLTACSTEKVGTANVSFSLSSVVAGVGNQSELGLSPAAASGMRPAALQPNEIAGMSFTPESVFVPITRISLNGRKYEVIDGTKQLSAGSGSADIYTCAGATPADCQVEISSPAAMAALSEKLKSVAIEEGVYETISVYNGFGDGASFIKGRLKARGSFQLQAVTYYTSKDGPVTDASAADYVELEISKGDWVFPIQANGNLEVVADEPASVSLIANYDGLLIGQQLSTLGMDEENGCSDNRDLEVAICAAQPDVIGYVGDVAPVLETYLLHFSGSGWYDNMTALFVFVVDAGSGTVIGIMPKQFLNGSIGGKTANFFGAVQHFTAHADGTLDFQNGEAGGNGYFSVSGFARKNHEGSIVLESQGTGQYKADKL